MKFLLWLGLAIGAAGQCFQCSRVALMAGATADVWSSRGLVEQNPVLGRGVFGPKQAVLSLGITGALVLVEGPLVRKWPVLRRPLTVVNWAAAGVRFSVARRNTKQ